MTPFEHLAVLISIVLLSTVSLYLAAAFALPEIEPDDTQRYDLR